MVTMDRAMVRFMVLDDINAGNSSTGQPTRNALPWYMA